MNVHATLASAISTVCDVPLDEVRPECELDALGVDSLASAEIIFEIEMALGRELPNHLLRQIDGVRTVGEVEERLTAELLGPAPAAP